MEDTHRYDYFQDIAGMKTGVKISELCSTNSLVLIWKLKRNLVHPWLGPCLSILGILVVFRKLLNRRHWKPIVEIIIPKLKYECFQDSKMNQKEILVIDMIDSELI